MGEFAAGGRAGRPGAGSRRRPSTSPSHRGGLEAVPEELGPLAGLVPALVELREYAVPEARADTIEDFIEQAYTQAYLPLPRECRERYAHANDVPIDRRDRDAKLPAPPTPCTTDVAHALEGPAVSRRPKLLERVARRMQEGWGHRPRPSSTRTT